MIMPIVDDKLKLVQNAATFEGLFNAVSNHSNTGTKFFRDDLTWGTVPKQFQSVITVSKTGYGDFVCSDAVYDGDDSACIHAALDYIESIGGGEVVIGDGIYNCSTGLYYYGSNLILRGQGNNTVLNFSSIPTSPQNLIQVRGEITTTNSTLAADATEATLTITVADGTKFTAGNWIRIRSEALFHPRDAVWNQKIGEIQQIESIAGNVLTLKEKLFGSYLVSDTATVDLVTMRENIIIKDMKIIGPVGVDHNGIYIPQAKNVLIDNVTFDDVFMSAVYLFDVVCASVTNTTVHRAYRTERGYGLAVSNASRDITASGNHYFNCRHAITCGGDNNYGIQYNQNYFGNTFSYDSKDQVMFGMHPSYNGLTVSGNTVSNGGLGFFNGINTTVVGNTCLNSEVWAIYLPAATEKCIVSNNIIHTKADICIALRTQYPDIIISNNILSCDEAHTGVSIAGQANNVVIDANIIKVGGTAITVTSYEGVADSSDIKITNNKITTTGSDPGIKLELYQDYNIKNVTIEGNTITSATAGNGISLERVTGIETFDKIDIINNTCYGGKYCIDVAYTSYVNIIGNRIYDAVRGLVLHVSNNSYTVDRNIFSNCATPLVNNMSENNNIITDNKGYNPVGVITAPGVPPSNTAQTNMHAYPCRIAVAGGTVSNIAINGTATGLTSGAFVLQPAESITLTYTVAPTWVWWGL